MISRCTNKNDDSYRKYGARGIKVCNEWRKDFWAFADHIGPRPSSRHSIDRINTHGDYEPGNVRWATPAQQNRNMRTNTYVEYRGQRTLLLDVPRPPKLSYALLTARLKLGWPLARALKRKVRAYRKANLS